MAKCVKQQRTKTQVCVGSMNRKIDILARDLTPPINPLTGQFLATETFVLVANVWAMVGTPSGLTIFDEVNTERVISHIFTIRFIEGIPITSQNWVTYKGNRYDIVMVTDFETNQLFLKLNCAQTADEDKQAGEA
jgi:head-tail adaptor